MKPLRVLVVEDDALIGALLAATLDGMGIEVCSIETTEIAAVAAGRRHKPDLMIVDAGLREGDGISAVDKILRGGFIPHLFVSGDAAAIRARRPGVVAIDKPYFESDLAQGIKRALAAGPSQ